MRTTSGRDAGASEFARPRAGARGGAGAARGTHTQDARSRPGADLRRSRARAHAEEKTRFLARG